MPRLRDALERFRPTGAPGAATSAGVPVDRRADASAELEPVFAALAATLRECDRIRHDSAMAAVARHDEAAERAAAVVSEAREQCEADRASEAALLRDRAQAAVSQGAAETAATTAQLRERAEARRPDLVALVVQRVRAELGFTP